MHLRIRWIACIAALLAASQTRAIIVAGDQGRNTSPPPGSMLTPWNLEGQFNTGGGNYVGTPISHQFFITAQHIGGGSTFTYGGIDYPIDTSYVGTDPGSGPGYDSIPSSDLRLWKIAGGSFSNYAPLYSGSFGTETTKQMFIAGRGASRGDPVTLQSARLISGYGTDAPSSPPAITGSGGPEIDPNALKGWRWGPIDSVMSWGTNRVDGTLTDNNPASPTFNYKFDYFFFDPTSILNASSDPDNEAILADKDSGAGLFVDVGGGNWQLAGVGYGVDRSFKGTWAGSSFDAAIFDRRGLWDGQGNTATFVSASDAFPPAVSFASAISASYGSISSIIAGTTGEPALAGVVPEPASFAIFGAIGGYIMCRRRR